MKNLSAKEVRELIERHEDFILVNVLEKAPFEEGHIPNSINIPVKDVNFTDRAKQAIPDRKEKVVVYCANMDCDASTKAAKQLENAGYQEVYDFKGGIKEWRDAGYPVQASSKGSKEFSPREPSIQSSQSH